MCNRLHDISAHEPNSGHTHSRKISTDENKQFVKVCTALKHINSQMLIYVSCLLRMIAPKADWLEAFKRVTFSWRYSGNVSHIPLLTYCRYGCVLVSIAAIRSTISSVAEICDITSFSPVPSLRCGLRNSTTRTLLSVIYALLVQFRDMDESDT